MYDDKVNLEGATKKSSVKGHIQSHREKLHEKLQQQEQQLQQQDKQLQQQDKQLQQQAKQLQDLRTAYRSLCRKLEEVSIGMYNLCDVKGTGYS